MWSIHASCKPWQPIIYKIIQHTLTLGQWLEPKASWAKQIIQILNITRLKTPTGRKPDGCLQTLQGLQWNILVPRAEAALLLVSTKNRDFWEGPIFWTCAKWSFYILSQSNLSDLTLSMRRVTGSRESWISSVKPSQRSRRDERREWLRNDSS